MENTSKLRALFLHIKERIIKALGGYRYVPIKTRYYYLKGTITMNMVKDVVNIAFSDKISSVSVFDRDSELVKGDFLKDFVEYDVPSEISFIVVVGMSKSEVPIESIYTIVGEDLDDTLKQMMKENNHLVKISK